MTISPISYPDGSSHADQEYLIDQVNRGFTQINAIPKAPASSSVSSTSKYESPQQTITSAGALTLAHGLRVKPTLFQAVLVCQTAEAGYSIEDEVVIYLGHQSTAGSDDKGFSLVPDATNLNIRFGNSGAVFVINRKDNGTGATLTNANWKLVIRAWTL
jgi:hypothetical protein